MNAGLVACLLPIPILVLLAAVFGLAKGKAAMLVSGFNTLPERQRAEYDADALSKDMRNLCLILTAVMAAGCMLSHFVSPYMAVAAYVIFVVLILKDVRLSADGAFGKYRKR